MKYKAVLFDLDGCLIDSTDVQKAAYFGSYAETVGNNRCPSFEDYMKYTGDSIDNVFAKMGLPAQMAAVYRRISRAAVDKVHVNWAVIELIKKLRSYGTKIGICTGKDHDRTVEIFDYYGISDLFDVLVCSDDVSAPKPAAESIIKSMDILSVTRFETIYVGDGYYDVLCAKNAGVTSVLTIWYGNQKIDAVPDYVADSVKELEDILFARKEKLNE